MCVFECTDNGVRVVLVLGGVRNSMRHDCWEGGTSLRLRGFDESIEVDVAVVSAVCGRRRRSRNIPSVFVVFVVRRAGAPNFGRLNRWQRQRTPVVQASKSIVVYN